MNHSAKPKISISSLILTVTIIAGIIIYAVSLLIKEKDVNRRSQSVPDRYSRRSEDTAMAKYQFVDSIASPIDTFLVLDNLTAKQIIETVSKYHHIPVTYCSKRLAKQDLSFAGTVNLDDNIKDILTILNRLNIYVKYDGKKLIAGE